LRFHTRVIRTLQFTRFSATMTGLTHARANEVTAGADALTIGTGQR
jgi:hypothetical protein